jgi:hypothetical protein
VLPVPLRRATPTGLWIWLPTAALLLLAAAMALVFFFLDRR